MEIMELVVAVLAGLATCIPLVIKLVQYIEKAAQEKHFGDIIKLVLQLMAEAEENYASGAERKEYVIDAIQNISDSLNYTVDLDKVSKMIDEICDASKHINIKPE